MKSIRRAYLEKRNKSQLNNTFNIIEDKNNNNQNKSNKSKIFSEKEKRDLKLHEDNLKQLEKLEKELYDLDKEYNLTTNKINSLKNIANEQNDNHNKINKEIITQNRQLNDLKATNDKKNKELNQLKEQHRQMIIRHIRGVHSAVMNELNRQTLHRFFERLRLRRQNNIGPPITNEQIQALPISYYPYRNNSSNQKCTICEFPYCYNDVIIKLRRCNHIFHKACLTNSLISTRASICPICKTSLI